MSRIVYIDIAGKKYPLLFSVRAAKEIFEAYQDLAGVERAVLEEGNVDATMRLLEVMLREGARYSKLVNGEEITPPKSDDLETLVPFYDAELRGALIGAIFNSSFNEIEVETDPKNA